MVSLLCFYVYKNLLFITPFTLQWKKERIIIPTHYYDIDRKEVKEREREGWINFRGCHWPKKGVNHWFSPLLIILSDFLFLCVWEIKNFSLTRHNYRQSDNHKRWKIMYKFWKISIKIKFACDFCIAKERKS